MTTSIVKCKHCGSDVEKENSAINRAKKEGRDIYCNRGCFGLARRASKTDIQKKAEKREYDKVYREKNRELIKNKKAEYFKMTYDPERAAIERKKRASEHAEYCRRPGYKKWKKNYDKRYRAKKNYGEFWECFLITQDIRGECLSLQSAYEIRQANQTLNKSQKRKRDEKTNRY